MKTNSIVLILFTLLFMTSCSKDSVEDNFIESEKSTTDLSLQERNPPPGCIITPGMVSNDEPGSYTMAPFSVYASTGTNTKNYDRRVEIYLTKNDDIVDVAYVTILANQNVSNNAAVQGCGGAVDVKIANVLNLSNSTLDYSCRWRQTVGHFDECDGTNNGYNVDNCNGEEGIGGTDENDEPINNDADGDGICAASDPDDNDPCTPIASDCW